MTIPTWPPSKPEPTTTPLTQRLTETFCVCAATRGSPGRLGVPGDHVADVYAGQFADDLDHVSDRHDVVVRGRFYGTEIGPNRLQTPSGGSRCLSTSRLKVRLARTNNLEPPWGFEPQTYALR